MPANPRHLTTVLARHVHRQRTGRTVTLGLEQHARRVTTPRKCHGQRHHGAPADPTPAESCGGRSHSPQVCHPPPARAAPRRAAHRTKAARPLTRQAARPSSLTHARPRPSPRKAPENTQATPGAASKKRPRKGKGRPPRNSVPSVPPIRVPSVRRLLSRTRHRARGSDQNRPGGPFPPDRGRPRATTGSACPVPSASNSIDVPDGDGGGRQRRV